MQTLIPTRILPNMQDLRRTQQAWAGTSLSSRLRIVRQLRDRIAAEAPGLVTLFPAGLGRSAAESITSEILPLLDACRFLEREASNILAPHSLSSRGRPLWLRRVAITLRREPYGLVLVIGPSNYPLFLAAVQVLQALVAGNAVLLKPGRAATPVLTRFAELAGDCGLPPDLLLILDEDPQSAQETMRIGVDKVVLTGSLAAGRAVLRQASDTVTPVTAELSGDDSVFVLPHADLPRAARAIVFGCCLNSGQTCIAPKRVYAHVSVASELQRLLDLHFGQAECSATLPPIINFSDENEIRRLAGEPSGYGLGAAIFGPEHSARNFAEQVFAGTVVINDMIVPTADPRVPFGGRGLSGFGTTRGALGLLEMTTAKAIVVQRAARLRHLEPLPDQAEDLFYAYLSAVHRQGWSARRTAWKQLGRVLLKLRSKERMVDDPTR